VADRKPLLANRAALDAFKLAASKLQHWRVLAAVLTPDHLHVLVASTNERDAKLGSFSSALKRWIRQELKATWKWQPGCFDRL
jgi:REP element-mobilizing transposase RayT